MPIILEPIDSINPATSLVYYARKQFYNVLSKFGGDYTRLRLTKTLNSLGSVTSISSDYAAVKVFFFDRFKSNTLSLPGVSSNNESTTVLSTTVRAYGYYDISVNTGDYLLVGYNSNDNSYVEKYFVVEKEAHEVNGSIVFYTLYLKREPV